MGKIETYREFFDEVAGLCSSLEALLDLAEWVNSEDGVVLVARPAVTRLREILDAADAFAGPELDAADAFAGTI